MNRFAYAVVGALLFSGAANAQTNVGAVAQTQVQSGAASQASNAGNTQQANFYTPDQQRVDYNAHGTQRIEAQAPLSLGGAAAGFSNENCANTTQAGLTTFWFGLAKGNAKESVRCNARRDAGVFTALAGDNASVGNMQDARALRSMAKFAICSSTDAYVEACKRLRLIGPDEQKNAPEQDNSGQVIPHREAGYVGVADASKIRTQ